MLRVNTHRYVKPLVTACTEGWMSAKATPPCRHLQSLAMLLASTRPQGALLTPTPWLAWSLACVAMILGAVLAGRDLDRQMLLDIQTQLRHWPVPWAFLTWSGLGICGFVLLTSLSAQEPRRVAALILALPLAPLPWRLQASARLAHWLRRPQVCKVVALSLPGFGLYLCLSRQGWEVPLGVQLGVMALCAWGAWSWWQASARPTMREGAA